MKYHVTVNGEAHEVELTERLGSLVVRYDGEPLDVRYHPVDSLGQVALFVAEKSYGVSISGDAQSAEVTVAGHLYRVTIEDERERAARAAERSRTKAGGELLAIMPGIVVKLLAKVGDRVVQGQALLLLEAMKMQNEIGAPADGVVKAIFVREGQAVAGGARLVSLGEPS